MQKKPNNHELETREQAPNSQIVCPGAQFVKLLWPSLAFWSHGNLSIEFLQRLWDANY